MAEGFDPLHKWLGIPPAEQPPNLYRLLGISLFESDPDVIAGAADQRMAHVRSFQIGAYSTQSQDLLNRLSAARVLLLNADRRAAYDRELRTQQALPVAARSEPPPLPGEMPVAPPALPPPLPGRAVELDLDPETTAARAFRPRKTSLAAAGGVALLIVVGGVVLWAVQRSKPAGPTGHAVAVDPASGRSSQRDEGASEGDSPIFAERKLGQSPVERKLGQSPADASYQAAERGLVCLRTDRATACGFVLDSSGLLAASLSSLKGVTGATAALPDGTCLPVQGFVAADASRDLVLLRVQPPKPLAALTLSIASPVGQSVAALGLAQGFAVNRYDTTVQTQFRGDELPRPNSAGSRSPPGGTWLKMTVAVSRSVRGGPVVDREGRVLGICCGPGAGWPVSPYALSAADVQQVMATAQGPPRPLDQLASLAAPGPTVAGVAPAPPASESPVVSASPVVINVERPARTQAEVPVVVAVRGRIELPSGAVFDESRFGVDRQSLEGWITAASQKDSRTASIRRRDDTLLALCDRQQASIDGRVLIFSANMDPQAYVQYVDGDRQGILKVWESAGKRLLCCEFVKARRHGVCCLFETDRPRLLVEYKTGRATAIHLVSDGKVSRSFADEAEAGQDPAATDALTRLAKAFAAEDELERTIRAEVREEDVKDRQKKAAALSVHKRDAIQSRINTHAQERQSAISSIRRMTGL